MLEKTLHDGLDGRRLFKLPRRGLWDLLRLQACPLSHPVSLQLKVGSLVAGIALLFGDYMEFIAHR